MASIPESHTMVLVEPSFFEKIDVGLRDLNNFLTNMVGRPCEAMITSCLHASLVLDPSAAGSLLCQLRIYLTDTGCDRIPQLKGGVCVCFFFGSCNHRGGVMSVRDCIDRTVRSGMPNLALATADPILCDVLRDQVQILEPPVAKDKKRKRKKRGKNRKGKRKGRKVERHDETEAETDAGKLEAHPVAEAKEKRKKRRRRGTGTREC